MATNVPKLPVYTGKTPVIGQVQPEFNINRADKLAYDAQLFGEEGTEGALNTTIEAINTASAEVEANATSAEESAQKAEDAAAFVGYLGEWTPETDVEAGGIYGYHGSEFRSLTGVSGVPPRFTDKVNWRLTTATLSRVDLPPFTASGGQSSFTIEVGLEGLQVNRDGTIEQSDKWSYNSDTGVLTLATPASQGERIQLSYNVQPSAIQPTPAPPPPPPPAESKQTVIVPLVSDIANFDSSQHEELVYLKTTGHTQAGIGASTYVKVDSSNPTDSFGFVVQDASGQKWRIDTGVSGVLWLEQLGAMPDFTGDCGAALRFMHSKVRTDEYIYKGKIGAGRFRFLSGSKIQAGDGYVIEGMGRQTILDASEATDEFDLFAAPDSVVEGFQLKNMRLRGSNVGQSYVIDWSRCRNTSKMENLFIGEGGLGWGVNGVKLNTNWYTNSENVIIRNLSGIGLHVKYDSIGHPVNGLVFSGFYLNGNYHNLVCEGIPGERSWGLVFVGCTFERSINTSIVSNYAANIEFIGCYSEGNFQNASSGETTQLIVTWGTARITGGLWNEYNGGNSGAYAFNTGVAGFISIGDGVGLKKANKSNFFAPNCQISGCGIITDLDLGFVKPVNSRYETHKLAGQPYQYIDSKIPQLYARMTTAPLAGQQVMNFGEVNLAILCQVDCTTTLYRDVWEWNFTVSDTLHGTLNGNLRTGSQTWKIVVRKEGESYLYRSELIVDARVAENSHGFFSVNQSGSVFKMVLSATPSMPVSVRWKLEPIMNGANNNVKVLEGY